MKMQRGEPRKVPAVMPPPGLSEQYVSAMGSIEPVSSPTNKVVAVRRLPRRARAQSASAIGRLPPALPPFSGDPRQQVPYW